MTGLIVWLLLCIAIGASRCHRSEPDTPPRYIPPPGPLPCRSQEEVDDILRAWGNRNR